MFARVFARKEMHTRRIPACRAVDQKKAASKQEKIGGRSNRACLDSMALVAADGVCDRTELPTWLLVAALF